MLSLEKNGVLVQVSPRDGVRRQGTRGGAVGKKFAGMQRFVLRLIIHVLPAGGVGQDQETDNDPEGGLCGGPAAHRGTSAISTA